MKKPLLGGDSMLNIERTIEDMENVFLELGFKRGKIGELSI